MLKADGFYPTAEALAFTPGFPDAVSFDSSSRRATVAGLAGAVQNFVLPNAPLPQVQQFLDWSNDYLAWFDATQANFGSSDGGGSSDMSSRSSGEVDTHSLTLTWNMAHSDGSCICMAVGVFFPWGRARRSGTSYGWTLEFHE